MNHHRLKSVMAVVLTFIVVLSYFPCMRNSSSNGDIGSSSRGNTIIVNASGGEDYTKIQWAINNASEGDTVLVMPGTYREKVVVNKSINLTGAGSESTIIDAGKSGTPLHIYSDWANVSGFTVRNSSKNSAGIYISGEHNRVANNNCSFNKYGISVYYNNSIINNTCIGNSIGINLFRTKNNYFSGNIIEHSDRAGIYLAESHSNVFSENICRYNNNSGIKIDGSHFSRNNTFISNTCNSNGLNGIDFWYTVNDTLENNTCSNNGYSGILLSEVNNAILKNNTASDNRYGIRIENYSTNNVISGNKMHANGISLQPITSFQNTVDDSNIVNGGRVYFWNGVRNRIIPEGAGQVVLYNCSDIVIENQNLTDTDSGIELWFSDNCTIENNTFNNNIKHGILLEGSVNTTIENNTCNNNKMMGVKLHGTEKILIRNNTFDSNIYYGLDICCSTFNWVYHNSFIDNNGGGKQAEDSGALTTWNTSSEGNYWSDWTTPDNDSDGIVDDPYTLAGLKKSQDHFPLARPVSDHFRNIQAPKQPEKDADGDGYNDTYENASGSDPYNKESTPLDWDGDGIPNEVDVNPHVFDGTVVDSNITENTNWTVEKSPYIINREIIIFNGSTLNIGRGVTVYFNGSGSFSTDEFSGGGRIRAFGRKDNKINFISKVPPDMGHRAFNLSLRDFIHFEYCSFKNIGEIYLAGTDNCEFYKCIFQNSQGIVFNERFVRTTETASENNTIRYCSFYNMPNAIKILSNLRYLDPNRFYQNNFYNSSISLGFDPIDQISPLSSTWNESGYGNYWWDYNGTDLDGDGVGDTNLPWHGVDWCPLMKPYSENPPVIHPNSIPIAFVEERYSTNFTATDVDTLTQELYWTMITNAPWLNFSENQELYGTPTSSDVGTYWIYVEVSDGPNSDFKNFTLDVRSWPSESRVMIERTGKDFSSIQDAIDNASNGDTIRVHGGIYYERIVINKSISLIGKGSDVTIIDGKEKGDVVEVRANNVSISGFHIRNASKSSFHGDGDYAIYYNSGIKIYNDSSKITYCSFSSSGLYGGSIFIYKSNRHMIYNNNFLNKIQKTRDILIIKSDNILIRENLLHSLGIWDSDANVIRNNSFGYYNKNVGDPGNGTTLYNSNRNIIEYNTFNLLESGLNISNSENTTIQYNRFTNNSQSVRLSGKNNLVYNNIFMNNSNEEYESQAFDWESDNKWYLGQTGNYWSDWTGPDADNDGIVDIPYNISGPAGAQDLYPLVHPPNISFNEGSPDNDTEKDSDGDGWNDTYELQSGSDPYNKKSTPLDWDGDGHPNNKDAYPRDPKRWKKERTDMSNILLFIGIGFIILLISIMCYSRIKRKNALKNDARNRIHSYIHKHPGEHRSGIGRQLGMNEGTLKHHLRKLEQTGMVQVRRDGKYKYLYPAGFNHSISLTPIQKQIIQILTKNKNSTTQVIAKQLDKERQTVVYHMKNLADKGVLRSKKTDKKVYWSVDENVENTFK